MKVDEITIRSKMFKGWVSKFVESKVEKALGKDVYIEFPEPIAFDNAEGVCHLKTVIDISISSEDLNDMLWSLLKRGKS